MVPNPKKITIDTDLEELLEEPGWVAASPEKLAEIAAEFREAARHPAIIHHGGLRNGAGRKPKALSKRRVQLSCSVAPATIRKFRALAKKEKASLGVILDRLVAAA